MIWLVLLGLGAFVAARTLGGGGASALIETTPSTPTTPSGASSPVERLHLSLQIRVSGLERTLGGVTARDLEGKLGRVIARLTVEARTARINWPDMRHGVRWLVSPNDDGFGVDVWWPLSPSVHPSADDLEHWRGWIFNRLRASENGDRISRVAMNVERITLGV